MKWSNLKSNKCPDCNKVFTYPAFTIPGLIYCNCGFKIKEKRFMQIVNSQITQDLEEKWNNEYENNI